MPDKEGRHLPPPPWDLEPEQGEVWDVWVLLLAREPSRAALCPSLGFYRLEGTSMQRRVGVWLRERPASPR